LNEKQARFVAEYLKDLNATQAAMRAGYSKRTSYAQGCRLLKHVEVAKAVATGQAKVAEKLELSAEKVLADIARICQKAEEAEEYSPAIKGHELLGKHLKLFTEVVESTSTVNVTARDITDDEWDRLSALTHQVRNG
jgi:phage terminase small subunit